MGLKSVSLLIFRILLLVVGFADLLGFLPPSLDILDKGLAAVILFMYWLQLSPSKFLFGSQKKWLDYVILAAFYLMVADIFFQLIRIIDFQLTLPIFSYIQNPANAAILSLFTSSFSFVMLLVISVVIKEIAYC